MSYMDQCTIGAFGHASADITGTRTRWINRITLSGIQQQYHSGGGVSANAHRSIVFPASSINGERPTSYRLA